MATIKSYTNLEQSKKLVEILPSKSADMAWYPSYAKEGYSIRMLNDAYPLDIIGEAHDEIPAWSLAVLLIAIPKRIKGYNVLRIDISDNEFAIWYDEIGCGVNNNLPDITKESAVDACVEMIIKLHELNLL